MTRFTHPEAVMNSTQSDMLRLRPSLSLRTAHPGIEPSSTKLKTPIWFKYNVISNSVGELALNPGQEGGEAETNS